jgi:hypothetical protein
MKKQKIYITDNEAAFILTILGREASDIDKKVFALNHHLLMTEEEMSHIREFPTPDQAIDYIQNGTEWHGHFEIV